MTGAEFPELAGRTGRFSYGAPRSVSVAADGSAVVFLRSLGPQDAVDALWVFDVTSGTERLIADPKTLASPDIPTDLPSDERLLRERRRLSVSGIGSFATDRNARIAVFTLDGRLFRAELRGSGAVTEVGVPGPVIDPRLDPTGTRIAGVVSGRLHVFDRSAATEIAGENGVTWGLAEFVAAEEFGRFRGYWWAPNGQSLLAARVDDRGMPCWHLQAPAEPEQSSYTVAYPRAGGPNADVTLHLLHLGGMRTEVQWDNTKYPYLVAAEWSGPSPLVMVLSRSQKEGLVLSVDPSTGTATPQVALTDPFWVEPIDGTPLRVSDGRLVVGRDVAAAGWEARCLCVGDAPLTPPSLYVHRLVGEIPPASGSAGPPDLLIEASEGAPDEQHLYRIPSVPGDVPPQRLTTESGRHVGAAGGGVLVIGSQSLDHAGTRWYVQCGTRGIGELRSMAADPPYAPRPVLSRVTDRGCLPRCSIPAATSPATSCPFSSMCTEVLASNM